MRARLSSPRWLGTVRTSESRDKPASRGNGTVASLLASSFDGYGAGYYDLRGFARHVGERARFSPYTPRFSHAIETNVLKCTHASARCRAPVCGDLARVVLAYTYACTHTRIHRTRRIAGLAEMEDSVVRRYPGGISHREISISAFLSTIPRSRTDYPLIRAGQRREVEVIR